MADQLNSYVTFLASFKRPESVCESTGEELANLLAGELPTRGVTVIKIEDGDFCHYLECIAGASTIELMVGFDQGNDYEDRWYVQLCGKQSFFGTSIPSASDSRILLTAVNGVLQAAECVWDIRWYPHFEVAEYLALLSPATGPMEPEVEEFIHPLIRLDRKLGRISVMIASPRCGIGALLPFIALIVLLPQYVGEISLAVFLAPVVILVVLPMIVARRIRREANRIFAERSGQTLT